VPSIWKARKDSPGFTLIEMLMVILVIAVLAGMILYSAGRIGQSNARADTVQKIEKVRAAIEEFYAEYGQYPPVPSYPGVGQPNYYEYPSVSTVGQAPSLRNNSDWSQGPIFTFGLMSYLTPRWAPAYPIIQGDATLVNNNTQWSTNNTSIDTTVEGVWGDQPRDLAAMKRWAPFLNGIVTTDVLAEARSLATYTNTINVVYDGWRRPLRYHSDPPYQSYDVWSVGPDGKDGGPLGGQTNTASGADDIHSGAGH